MYTWNLKDLPSHLFAASSMEGTHFYIWEKHLRTQNRSVTLKKKKNYLYWWRWGTFSIERCWGTTIDFWWSVFWGCWTGEPRRPCSPQLKTEGKPGCGACIPFAWEKGHCTLQKQGPNNPQAIVLNQANRKKRSGKTLRSMDVTGKETRKSSHFLMNYIEYRWFYLILI